jgi:hypothetical protein
LATATLETEFCGQRLSTPGTPNQPRRRWKGLGKPTAATANRGNVVLFYGLANHVDLRGLPGGAEGIRTDGHRGFAASNRGISLVNFKGAYGRNASANHLSLFARKPQIQLVFVPEESNGYDVLKGA